MWFQLKGDERLGRCATEDCGGQPTSRLEADGTGSNYCSGCRAKIEGHWICPHGVVTGFFPVPDNPHLIRHRSCNICCEEISERMNVAGQGTAK